jgi:glucose-1-phosphate adenylyltransferase
VRTSAEAEAYWRDVGTVDAYWQANIDLTDALPSLNLYDRDWPIWTFAEVTPPAKFVGDEAGDRGLAENSLVAGGCIVSGAQVRRSLLFTGVRIEHRAHVENSVILPHVKIGAGARLTNVVVDRGVAIPERLVIGEDPQADAGRFRRTERGICLVTQPMIDRLTNR